MRQWLEDLRDSLRTLFLSISGAIGFVVGFKVIAEQPGSTNFHAAGAQVIPLLIIALGVETRVFRPPTRMWAVRILLGTTLLILALGEGVALGALNGSPSHDGLRTVGSAILAGGSTLVALALLGPATDEEWRKFDEQSRQGNERWRARFRKLRTKIRRDDRPGR